MESRRLARMIFEGRRNADIECQVLGIMQATQSRDGGIKVMSSSQPQDVVRRTVLQTAAGIAIAPVLVASDANADVALTPGKPGDFNFLSGEWRIQHRRKRAGDVHWDEFSGEATCWTILGGVGSVEELRIPARDFSGMGLRLLDVEKKVWSDFWVNAKSGVLGTPGMTGSFENGAGVFIADDTDGKQPIKVRGVWDQITPMSCRWHQAVSRDGGKTWEENWIMHWTRVR